MTPAAAVRNPVARDERVLLLSLPFGSLTRPSLALGLLAGHCGRLEIDCDVRYLTLSFAELVGPKEYLWLGRELPYEAFASDWLFTEALYGPRPEADAAYVEEVLRGIWHLRRDTVARIQALRPAAEPFLRQCMEEIDWSRYTFVGFTSMFQQNIASLALAARVKAAYPDLTIAFGGANWESPMGEGLQRRFPFVDLVFSGEADVSFPATLAARRGHGDATATTAERLADLDELPLPDFDSFFEQVRSRPALAGVTPQLLVETARGCWWGERSHCTFCGLNGSTMAFRSKSPQRDVEEFAYLSARHRVRGFWVVDDILDMRYFRTVLPMLERERLDIELFWEVKANLSAKHVRTLWAAGVRSVQPGIESFSDNVLALMRKGTTGLKNIELLKWCREYDVKPVWNLLYGFPGETEADYEETRAVIEAIWHLDPPQACGHVRMDRFSPYHEDPEAFGMENIRPKAPLSHIYPFPREDVMEIAYYFDFDYADGRRANALAGRALELAGAWMDDTDRGMLALTVDDDRTVHLVDSRRRREAEPERIDFGGWQADVFLACDTAQSPRELLRLPIVREERVSEGGLKAFLADCVDRRLMVDNGRSWLNVAVHVPPRDPTSESPRLTASLAVV
jgi:ribosomal peptide maturation radical SAM protein 1